MVLLDSVNPVSCLLLLSCVRPVRMAATCAVCAYLMCLLTCVAIAWVSFKHLTSCASHTSRWLRAPSGSLQPRMSSRFDNVWTLTLMLVVFLLVMLTVCVDYLPSNIITLHQSNTWTFAPIGTCVRRSTAACMQLLFWRHQWLLRDRFSQIVLVFHLQLSLPIDIFCASYTQKIQ